MGEEFLESIDRALAATEKQNPRIAAAGRRFDEQVVAIRDELAANRWRPQPGQLPRPGETLLEALSAKDWSQVRLAQHAGLSAKHINQIIRGNARITPAVAVLIGKATGIDPYLLARLQVDYDVNQILGGEGDG